MTLHRFKKSSVLVPIGLILVFLVAIACGSADAPTQAPTSPPVSAATATAAPLPTPMVEGQGVEGQGMEGMEAGRSFADYWRPPTAAYGEPISGGELRVIYEDPLEHANTWGAATGAADRFLSPTHNLIVQEDPYDANNPAIPDLAESWTIAGDNMSITFNFHDGIKWHNGTDFVCEDARFSLETMITGEGLTSSYMRGRLQHIDVDGLECLDDQTLLMPFKGPTGVPLLALTNRRAPIFNKAWFEAGGEEAMFQDPSVGTGAFRWAAGQKVGDDTQHFEKNPDYFFGEGTLPYLDRLTIVGIVDESAQQAAMLAHQGDWHWVRNWGQYRAYVDHDQIQTVIRATRGNHALWLNARNEPFDNVRVRQAIVMGIDRKAGIAVLQDGHASPGFLYSPGSPWQLTEEQGCAVPGWCVSDDMAATRAEAKQILADEGFDFDKTYLFTVESDAQVVGRATFVQEQLRLLDIKTDFDLVETVSYRNQEQNGLWGDFMPRNDTMSADDPSAGLGAYLRCASNDNRETPPDDGICDATMEALLDRVDGTLDSAERKKLSDEIQLKAMRDYYRFPIYWEQEAVAFWPEVKGFAHFPAPYGAWLKYQHMWINPADKDAKGFSGQTTGFPGGL
ncbi:MAG TPA: ABC transporter substrate-binding protein [Dehalococcoidia bacterium]|nr:ABC transporter substrate-binding protein [Dehalococcoidia bacterium]